MPDDFGELLIQTETTTPTQSLWLAVVHQAILDATNNAHGESSASREYFLRAATAWLSRNSRDFQDVCVMAGLNPDDLKERASSAIEKATNEQ